MCTARPSSQTCLDAQQAQPEPHTDASPTLELSSRVPHGYLLHLVLHLHMHLPAMLLETFAEKGPLEEKTPMEKGEEVSFY